MPQTQERPGSATGANLNPNLNHHQNQDEHPVPDECNPDDRRFSTDLLRVEYGSPEWHSLPVTDRRRGDAVRYAAECWRALNASPHVAELIADWVEWHRRRGLRAISNDVSASADWRQLSNVPTYAEIERRRSVSTRPELTSAEIRAQTDASWARVEQWIADRKCT